MYVITFFVKIVLMPRKSGFTLIELLIVISIIAILAVIGLVAYSTFLKNARDARRQSDLKFIQSALEEYHSDQHAYPTALTDLSPASGKIYITTIPKEPVPGRPEYNYACTANCVSYCLSASLENTSFAPENGCSNPIGDYNFTITRP